MLCVSIDREGATTLPNLLPVPERVAYWIVHWALDRDTWFESEFKQKLCILHCPHTSQHRNIATFKSLNDSSREGPSQIDSADHFLHHSWQLFCLVGTKVYLFLFLLSQMNRLHSSFQLHKNNGLRDTVWLDREILYDFIIMSCPLCLRVICWDPLQLNCCWQSSTRTRCYKMYKKCDESLLCLLRMGNWTLNLFNNRRSGFRRINGQLLC